MIIVPALLLPLLAAAIEPPALMPETPDGWRYERIDFPLSFAPDLDHEGYEELRFAPGMFEPDSASYFTYVFGIRLEGDVVVDTAFVERFLGAYYSGLCEAVAESRSLDLDMSVFDVNVRPVSDRRFEATIDMYDPFVTGEPLTLALEMDVRRGIGTTDAFSVVSPKPDGDPVWDVLHDLGRRWRAARATPPEWFTTHVDEMVAGGGRWVADNAAYRSDAETFDAYVLELARGVGGSLTGRMLGVEGDGEPVVLSELFLAWHPGEGAARHTQLNLDGTMATARIEPMRDRGVVTHERFFMPDGSEMLIRHEMVEVEAGVLRTESFLRGADGAWTSNRVYEWRLDG